MNTTENLRPRAALPNVADEPKSAWSNGWWAGLGVGFVNGIGAALIAYWSR